MLAASAVVVSAAAAETSPLRGNLLDSPKKINGMNFQSESLPKLEPKGKQAKGLRKVDGSNSLEGEWAMMFLDLYFEDSVYDGIRVNYTASVDGTTVTFTPNSSTYQKMIAEYDEEAGVLIFSREYVGIVDGFYAYQQPFIYNYETNEMDYQDLLGELCMTQNVVIFPQAAGMDWHAFSDQDGTQDKGFLDLYDFTIFFQPNPGEWNDIGNASFIDGWLIPAYGEDQNEYVYEVAAQQSASNPKLLRLVNPYKYGPLSEQNSSRTNGYIVFDISDPDHVVFNMADAGFSNKQSGITSFFAYNWLGALCFVNPGYYPWEIAEAMGDAISYTTYKDGVIATGQPVNNRPDTRFGTQLSPTYGNYWAVDDYGTIANMSARIVLPEEFVAGVGAIEVDNSNAPVEYYNLQGMRILNPQAGQLVIKRQGTKTSKLIVK